MTWARFFKSFTKTGVAALALAALATAGNAREVYKGKFTLAAKMQWGDVTLPAGDYSFTLPSTSFPYTLYIHGTTVDAIVMAVTIDEAAVSRSARLDLMDVTAVPAVQKLEAPELGLTFIYWTLKQKRLGSKEARQKSVPEGGISASQVTETKCSSRFTPAGRWKVMPVMQTRDSETWESIHDRGLRPDQHARRAAIDPARTGGVARAAGVRGRAPARRER